jgi:hypothetical protein
MANNKRVKRMNITDQQYRAEVNNLAASIVIESATYTDCNTLESFDEDTIRDHIFDNFLHETIDEHQWVIYYAYNLDVLQYSDNSDYMVDELGVEYAGQVLKDQGLSGLHSALAYWALYADVVSYIDDALNQYQENLSE